MNYHEVLKPTICSGEVFDLLLSLGWYPMGQKIFTTSHLFKDDGTTPMRVHWLRYPVTSVIERTSHRRICSKNKYFDMELVDPFVHKKELDVLYDKYLSSVDFEGYPSIEKATFRGEEVSDNIYNTKAIIMREGERIVSCGIFHEGVTSIASVLHFYDPEYNRFSPGKYLILKTLDYCRLQGIEWYYPGYVIQGNSKMNYKLFLGQELAQYYFPDLTPLSGSWLPFRSDLLSK
ncbi:MAG: GNAT family N-acetyltransferase [Spirochaetaceae bacterium]|jgi:arginyl-tRNA--protein-N-Asp/Glu arginylyltransferase|nr:GNAT family N-acetyltransferase [Spirochaetaceae bacterium]